MLAQLPAIAKGGSVDDALKAINDQAAAADPVKRLRGQAVTCPRPPGGRARLDMARPYGLTDDRSGDDNNWRRLNSRAAEQINGWLFVAPALVLLGIFMIYPIFWSLWMSFQVGKGMNFSFGGWANIVRLTKDPVFLRALGNTCIFFVVQVPIMITLALLFAVALNDPTLRFRGVFRTAIFLPCVTSLIAYSTLFKSMFAQDGVVNKALLFLHVTSVARAVAAGSVLGQGPHHPRHHLALDRLQHGVLPRRPAEHRSLDLRGCAHRRRAAPGRASPASPSRC